MMMEVKVRDVDSRTEALLITLALLEWRFMAYRGRMHHWVCVRLCDGTLRPNAVNAHTYTCTLCSFSVSRHLISHTTICQSTTNQILHKPPRSLTAHSLPTHYWLTGPVQRFLTKHCTSYSTMHYTGSWSLWYLSMRSCSVCDVIL